MSASETVQASNEILLGNRLDDMGALDWREALGAEAALLRVARPSTSVLEALAERFGLDSLYVKDICNPAHPPQFSRLEEGGVLLILRFPIATGDEAGGGVSVSVSLLADNKLCVLIWPGERYQDVPERELRESSVDECVAKFVHHLIDPLLRRVYVLRDEMDDVEDECLANVDKADLGSLLLMRKEFATLARNARTNAMVIEQLRMHSIYRENLHLMDAQEHMQRASVIAESRSEHALSVMQAVQSLLSQRLNEVMRLLAMITVVLTPMGVIAGIFGMNFSNMSVLQSPHGFGLALLSMLILGGCLVTVFKLKRWW
ncbi:MAG: CorA family divalent cation transporter [Gallionella sp.]|nr:CorA family divalent cation transporter [Gallionella sp.]